jgi:hypothetical protein
MDRVEYIAGANPTVVGRQLLVVLAGEGAEFVADAISGSIDEAATIEQAVDLIVAGSAEFTPDFVVAQFLGTVMQSQFRGSRLAIRVARRDGTEVIFRARQTSGWSTITETDCFTAEVMDVAAATGRSSARPVKPGSFTSSRLKYRSGVPALPAAVTVVAASVEAPAPVVAVLESVADEVPSRTTLEFTNGRQVDVDRTILIGRSPRAERTTAADIPTLFPVESPGHAISRTHLKISIDGSRVLLEDLNSTNGTEVTSQAGSPLHLLPGEQALLTDGMVVSLGDQVAFKVVTLP